MINFSRIKLIIWDLDETFWRGVLSDNTVCPVIENIQLVKDLIDAGVMCSICSKNEKQQVEMKLEELGLWDLFVFVSVNWTSKGERVKQIVHEMQLRENNVLFLDDNPLNRAEAQHFCPEIMTADVDILPKLWDFFSAQKKTDIAHKRLEQYKVLEKKRVFRAGFGSNEEFLYSSGICVKIHSDCLNHLSRITDLIQRSNQLNFTKVRCGEDEIRRLIEADDTDCGYVTVTDTFGDYGIVGFYAIQGTKLLHYVFSCRALGMGVEQYVYRQLGMPMLTVVGDVASSVYEPEPRWINQSDKKGSPSKLADFGEKKVVFKGPCDITQIFAYIHDGPEIIKEFVYVNNRGISIESGCHSIHLLESRLLDEKTKHRLAETLPFGDYAMFQTAIFDPDIDCVVYSLFTDPNLGLYREKSSGAVVAFGEYTNDLTDESRWDEYINKEVFVANCDFTEENLRDIKNRFEFIGRLDPKEVLDNLMKIRTMMQSETLLMLCLGSEIPYDGETTPAYENRAIYN